MGRQGDGRSTGSGGGGGGGAGGGVIGPGARHVVDQLSAYLEGDMKPRVAEAVGDHLAACDPCARAAAELRAIVASARSLDRPEPPPTLWSAIEGALAEADAAPLLAWRRFFVRGFAAGGLAGAALVLLVLVTLGFTRGRDHSRSDGDPSRSEADRSFAVAGELRPGPGAGAAVAIDPLLREAEDELRAAADSYEHSIAKLRALLARREEPRWSPDVRARFIERLTLLDEAIERSRAAARSTPGDGAGNEILFAAYRSKIDFLAAAVHRGGPEELLREGTP